MRRVAKKLFNIYIISRLMGKRRYNPLANLRGFVNLTNKKRKTSNLKGNTRNLTPSQIHATQAGSDSEKENVSGKLLTQS